MTKSEKMRDWIGDTISEGRAGADPRALDEALYALGELGLLESGGISARDALVVWASVEKIIHTGGFPTDLRM